MFDDDDENSHHTSANRDVHTKGRSEAQRIVLGNQAEDTEFREIV